MSIATSLLKDLKARGLIAQMTAEDQLVEHLNESRAVYCGFDPTADSLHLGHLVPLLVLKRFQNAGHKPIALVGGATGLIGDPSFKAEERKLNTPDIVANWVDRLKAQVSQFIDFEGGSNAAEVVNNLDWVGEIDVLTFLRDVGKHFSINSMINKESVQLRINRDGAGISFTEFSYALLQGLDFAELNRRHNCTIQLGGSDQWGNIVGGIDLTRRQNKAQAFGITVPLVTKADGTKFGKTESGAVWLDPAKTSPYAFYQFWLNTADADAYKFLRYFTFLPVERIEEIEQQDAQAQGRPEAQAILGEQVTQLVHGKEGLEAAKRITQALFQGDAASLAESDFEQIKQDGLPFFGFPTEGAELTVGAIVIEAGLASSGKQVKDALARGAVLINGLPVEPSQAADAAALLNVEKAFFGRFFLVKFGKKKYMLIERK